MSQNRLMNVLLAPRITEKSVASAETNNAYVFKVIKDATKPEIKKAIELMFEVKVAGVRTSTVKGKTKRSGVHFGKRASWKKAVVTLGQGESIELMDAE